MKKKSTFNLGIRKKTTKRVQVYKKKMRKEKDKRNEPRIEEKRSRPEKPV